MDSDTLALMIPIISIVFGLGIAMLCLVLRYLRTAEAVKAAHAERMAAIARGIELPPPAAPYCTHQVTLEARCSPSQRRASGLVLIFLGAAITLALWQSDSGDCLWGLVPAAIGTGQLAASLLDAYEQRARTAAQDTRRPLV